MLNSVKHSSSPFILHSSFYER